MAVRSPTEKKIRQEVMAAPEIDLKTFLWGLKSRRISPKRFRSFIRFLIDPKTSHFYLGRTPIEKLDVRLRLMEAVGKMKGDEARQITAELAAVLDSFKQGW
jgi:hypothetical protein